MNIKINITRARIWLNASIGLIYLGWGFSAPSLLYQMAETSAMLTFSVIANKVTKADGIEVKLGLAQVHCMRFSYSLCWAKSS